MVKRLLLTGGAGFAGHHFIEHVLKNTDWEMVLWDRLSYASSGFDRLREISVMFNKRVLILTVDFSQPISEGVIKETGRIDYLVHMGAETHVDNSIENSWPFIQANVIGTYHMLEYAKKNPVGQFVYFSTDEVFGPANDVKYKEWDRYNSTNPYSATKAGGEELCLAYANTYGIPMLVTHTMNLFGERQHWEKFIPKVIRKVMKGESVLIHSDSAKMKAGQRHYIHCRNMADGVMFLLNHGIVKRDKYNIVGELEIDNLSLAVQIAEIIGKPLRYEMVDFHSSRPGHDLRYALDGSKMAALGWSPINTFAQSLEKTIYWYMKHPKWLGLPALEAVA